MNIWYLHHYATPYELPGLHRPFEFGKFFVKKNNRLAVFTSSYLHYSGDNVIKNKKKYKIITYDNIDAVFVKTSAYDNIFERIINMMQYWKRVVKIAQCYSKKFWNPDIIIASSPHPLTMLSGIKLAKKFNVPCVCEVRDFWPEDFFYDGIIKEKSFIGRFLLKVEKYIYENADELVFLKEGDYTYITDRGWDRSNGGTIDLKKCHYVNNGVDLNLFDERAKKFDLDITHNEENKKFFDVVYCGTVRPGNHIDQLLDTAKLLPDDIRFLIYGTGSCIADIEKRVRSEHINNVVIKGYIDNKYVPCVLKNASATILNYSDLDYNWSRGNSSNKLFEYLASGKPVISTVNMGYDILKKYNCGVSAEKCTPIEIAKSIFYIYNLPKKDYIKMCENSRIASKDFDIFVLSNKYLDILKNAIDCYDSGGDVND